ncbi:MAG: hypothetical protein JWM31_378 [Solirubrobacterales bacterium]|nr:hypothetical protein [Solirubrobacterales bacterium]
MAVTAMRLVNGSSTLELTRETGYRVQKLDIGFPTVRPVSQGRTDRDGEDDTTELHGASAVSMDIKLFPTTTLTLTEILDSLRAFCHPKIRPYLVVERDGVERRIMLRADQQSAPITNPFVTEVQVAWRAPDGVEEAVTEEVGLANAVASAAAGRSYPRTYPLTYPASSAVGSVTVTNSGTVPVLPVLRLYGPCTNPRVENQTTGEQMVFSGLTIAAGDYLEIDSKNATIRLNGLSNQSRYNLLSFAVSTFPHLEPGLNTVRYYPVSFSTGARLEVRYRSAWI